MYYNILKNCWVMLKILSLDQIFLIYRHTLEVSNGLGGVHKLRLQNLSFFDHLPPSVYIFYGIKVYKKLIFLTTYPPPLVNVVCERPLIAFICERDSYWNKISNLEPTFLGNCLWLIAQKQ